MHLKIDQKYEMKFPNGSVTIASLSKIDTYGGHFPPDYFFYYISGDDELVNASTLREQNLFPLPVGCLALMEINEVN
jgi:hypothetical protein